ncbi:MAG: ribosome small subunit-dependent GTPase A [Dehalococcoidia bacterium]|nr:ribosome small subunit-dependent GTPase A [Dehalococcoidia bacterium]
MRELISWGFGPYFQQQLSDNAIPARIAAEHRDGYVVWSTAGEGLAKLSGRLIRDLQVASYPGVGDWVTLRALPLEGESSIIDGLLDRRTLFTRAAAGQQTRGQVIAANVDIVFVVSGLDADYNIRRIERYLARIWASGAEPIVILNKADVCDDVAARIAEIEAVSPGLTVIATSAKRSEGLDGIRQLLHPGTTGAFVGSSGAGKSTLINSLLGEERFATSEVRADDSRGRHTTTHRQLVVLPWGGLLVDTPGMRELALYDDEGIDAVFSDIESMSAHCRFRDCSHQGEPGCAVQQAVHRGEIPAERLDHYLKLRAEARSYELRSDERLRRKGERAFSKRIGSDLKLIRKWKEGR